MLGRARRFSFARMERPPLSTAVALGRQGPRRQGSVIRAASAPVRHEPGAPESRQVAGREMHTWGHVKAGVSSRAPPSRPAQQSARAGRPSSEAWGLLAVGSSWKRHYDQSENTN